MRGEFIMKLYGSPASPYVRKARVLLKEKRIPCEFVVVDAWAPDNGIAERNPLGKVPTLEIGPGNYLFESALIVHYLDQLDGRPLQPKEPAGYWQSQWWQALGNGLIDAAVARVQETRRPPDKQMPEKIEREEGRVARALATAERAYQDGKFLVGARFTLADLVMGVAVQYMDFRYPHEWRAKNARLEQWFEKISARKSFETTLPPGFVKRA